MARPTKLTTELQERLCLHLTYGATRTLAAQAEGVAARSLYYWLKKPAFLQAVEQAEAAARTQKLALMHMAAQRGSWQAAAWLLERLDPQAYGEPPRRVQLSGEDGGPVTFTITIDRPAGHGPQEQEGE